MKALHGMDRRGDLSEYIKELYKVSVTLRYWVWLNPANLDHSFWIKLLLLNDFLKLNLWRNIFKIILNIYLILKETNETRLDSNIDSVTLNYTFIEHHLNIQKNSKYLNIIKFENLLVTPTWENRTF